MRRTTVLFLLAVSAFAAQSVVLTPGRRATATMNVPALANYGDWRIEMTVHANTCPSDYTTIWNQNHYSARWYPDCSFTVTGWQEGSALAQISTAGRTSFHVRFQRKVSTRRITMEIWNTDGTGYALSVATSVSLPNPLPTFTDVVGSQFSIGDTASNGQGLAIARLSWFSYTATEGSLTNDTPDIADWSFEGNSVDSVNSLTLGSWTSGPAYMTTPTLPPLVSVSPTQTDVIRAGASFTPSVSAYTFNGAMTYSWAVSEAPTGATPRISSKTALNPTFTGLDLFGQYTFTLTATDAVGASTAVPNIVGAVPTDSNGAVILSNNSTQERVRNTVLGPLARRGADPWPFHDAILKSMSDTASALIIDGTYAPDMTYVDTGATCTYGTGPNYDTAVCSGTDLTTLGLTEYAAVAFAWNSPEGTNRGLYSRVVDSVTSATTLKVKDGNIPMTVTSAPLYKLTSSINNFVDTSNDWCYYDPALALYREYWRTGLTKYRTAARILAPKCAKVGRNWGFSYIGQRQIDAGSMTMLYADLGWDIWPGLYSYGVVGRGYTDNYYGWTSTAFPTFPNNIGDLREFLTGTYVTALATLDTNPTRKALACSHLTDTLTLYFAAKQAADGHWTTLLGESNASPYFGPGLQPFHMGYGSNMFAQAMDAYASADRCNDPTMYTTTRTMFLKAAAWLRDNYKAPDGGWYGTLYTKRPAGVTLTGYKVRFTGGSTTVTGIPDPGTGANTSFLSQLSVGQTLSVGAAVPKIGNDINWSGVITAIASDTSLTVDLAVPGSSTYDSDASAVQVSKAAYANCAPSLASTCDGSQADYGSRDVVHPVAAMISLAYQTVVKDGLPGAATWKTALDLAMGETYGTTGGPSSDGSGCTNCYYGAYGSSPLSNNADGRGKPFGFVGGLGGTQRAPVDRLGGVATAAPQTIVASYRLDDVPGAAYVRLTLRSPDGTTAATTCAASTCSASTDGRQPVSQFRLEYLTAGGVVLRTGEWQPVAIQ